MYSNKLNLKFLVIFIITILVASCSDKKAESNIAKTKDAQAQPIALDVFKSPTCGCCSKWINHINENGFKSEEHDLQNISSIKEKKGIEPRYRSCHTAISKDGYAFEGHVPAKFIQQFLKEKHGNDVIGLSVPAMPLGSPGMEVDDKFHPYKVLLLKSDGTYEVYAEVHAYEEQF